MYHVSTSREIYDVISNQPRYAGMAVSSCLGAQTLNIAIGLGLPWLLAALMGDVSPEAAGRTSYYTRQKPDLTLQQKQQQSPEQSAPLPQNGNLLKLQGLMQNSATLGSSDPDIHLESAFLASEPASGLIPQLPWKEGHNSPITSSQQLRGSLPTGQGHVGAPLVLHNTEFLEMALCFVVLAVLVFAALSVGATLFLRKTRKIVLGKGTATAMCMLYLTICAGLGVWSLA